MSYITLGGVNQLIYKILGSIIYNLVFNFQDKVFISIICKMTNMSFKPFFFSLKFNCPINEMACL